MALSQVVLLSTRATDGAVAVDWSETRERERLKEKKELPRTIAISRKLKLKLEVLPSVRAQKKGVQCKQHQQITYVCNQDRQLEAHVGGHDNNT